MSLLLTGATGTFGRAFLRRALGDPRWRRICAFSRDEVKQAALLEEFEGADGLRLFLGDVRDAGRLRMAMRDVTDVVHAAALKRVDAGAYAPGEIIHTNVMGTMHVVEAAIQAGVERVVVLSSDKAVAPTNIYGYSKGMAETFAVQANAYRGKYSPTRIAAVRYGNIVGSRGSVVHVWRGQYARRVPLTLTDRRMTRFMMTIEQAVDLVLFALARMHGGEVFVPQLPAAYMGALAQATIDVAAGVEDAEWPITEVGLRPGGEKLAEALLNEEEPSRTHRLDGHYVIRPSHHEWTKGAEWADEDPVPEGFVYRSDTALPVMTVAALRDLIRGTEALR